MQTVIHIETLVPIYVASERHNALDHKPGIHRSKKAEFHRITSHEYAERGIEEWL